MTSSGLDEAIAELKSDGFAILPNVLSPAEAAEARSRLDAAAIESERRGVPTHYDIDPNDRNIRVFGLLDLDGFFRDLILHPTAASLVASLVGDDFMISNFTANIALPGSQSMKLHSDLSIVLPEPWFHPWSMNIIWCLDDVYPDNGATRYVPGSHTAKWRSELGADPEARLRPFEAPAGSIVAMDGRMWHTSGANITADVKRRMLFGYYSANFIRPQTNWNALLSPETISRVKPELSLRLGLGPDANTLLAAPLAFGNDAAPLRA